jgi:hypothetical protein
MADKGIHKYKSWDEVPETNLEFWLKKTPSERLDAAKKLIERAENLYHSNPKNKKLYSERRLSKFHTITERAGN